MGHILIVDDFDLKRAVLLDSIRELAKGATVREAASRLEAEQAFAEQQPDLIFMDASFPLKPGGETVREAGEKLVEHFIQLGYQGIIVAFSGDPSNQERLLLAGCQLELSSMNMRLKEIEKILQRAELLSGGS